MQGGGSTIVLDATLGADAATIDVTAIVGSYKALQFILSGRSTDAVLSSLVRMRINSDAGTNYDNERIFGNSGGVGQDGAAGEQAIRLGEIVGGNGAAGRVGQLIGYIHNYAGTSFHKVVTSTGGYHADTTTGRLAQHSSGIWLSTAAITTLSFFPNANNFLAGTRLTVFGL